MNYISLKNMNVWLSGGNKGIGLSIAKQLIDNESIVISSGRSEFDSKSDISDLFLRNYSHLQLDISNYEKCKNTYNHILSRFGDVDILVNNAGMSDFTPFSESDINLASTIIQTNLMGAINLTHLVLPSMIKRRRGIIVNISSVGALENFANCSVYNASKSGLLSFSKSLRKEIRQFGIKIIDILPGATYTELWDENSREEYKDKMMFPEDIANTVVECIKLSLNNRMMVEEILITPQLGNL